MTSYIVFSSYYKHAKTSVKEFPKENQLKEHLYQHADQWRYGEWKGRKCLSIDELKDQALNFLVSEMVGFGEYTINQEIGWGILAVVEGGRLM